MRISYNSPVVLTFALVSLLELGLNSVSGDVIGSYFSSPSHFEALSLTSWIASVLHVLGHVNFEHYAGNMMFLLLLGPILEEKYGSSGLFLMILVAAITTSVVNAMFLSGSIIGASGIVFMMITLASMTNLREGTIPLSLILIIILYVGKEIFLAGTNDGVSHFGHIFGGFSGACFGLLFRQQKTTAPA